MHIPAATEDLSVFERVFWQICEEDFPAQREQFKALYLPGLDVVNGKSIRPLNKACDGFFTATKAGWPRYDAYLAYWNEADPRIEPDEDEEEPDDYAMPPGELLAHRIVMGFYAERTRLRYLENTDDRPFWRLSVLDDGRAYQDCFQEATPVQRFDSAYWQQKKLPCERLFCRCDMQALTEAEAVACSGSTGCGGM